MLKLALKTCQLDELASTRDDVELAFTLDGAKLTSNLFHVTAGTKAADIRSRHPLNGKLLLQVASYFKFSSIQSQEHAFVFKMHLMTAWTVIIFVTDRAGRLTGVTINTPVDKSVLVENYDRLGAEAAAFIRSSNVSQP